MNKELGITISGSNETPTEWNNSYTTCCINFSLTIHNSRMCHTQKY